MTWVQTFTGVAFDLVDCKPGDVRAADLAHALAFSCRFGGHTRTHYSVAQHSILVAAIVWHRTRDRAAALHGLLHDAHEAYVGDIKKPVKWAIEQVAGAGILRSIEAPIDAAIFAWAGLPVIDAIAAQVKRADNEILLWERDRFLGAPAMPWVGEHTTDRLTPADFGVKAGSAFLEPWNPLEAERAFFYALGLLVPERLEGPADAIRVSARLWLELRLALPSRARDLATSGGSGQ